tara:strand:+ start:3880 stop:4890 length:1011 start_codon:yes stop_codon:yes gene_type:complete
MELWIDRRDVPAGEKTLPNGFTRSLDGEGMSIEGKKILLNGAVIGAYIHIRDGTNQDDARALIGSVEWLLVSFEDWSMIPLENFIAASEGTPTKIAALLTDASQIQGAAFALERGVDAIVVSETNDLVEAAQIAMAQRLERPDSPATTASEVTSEIIPTVLTITSVEDGGLGERYCIDFTSLLRPGEGMLIGSNASSFMLVHGETVSSEFVPVRPFRVNAGSPQSYTLMADGSTKYLAELSSGDNVTVVNHEGHSRHVVVGRLKIEQRPLLLLKWMNANHKEGHMFLQQAETVRAVDSSGIPVSVTSISIGDEIFGWNDTGARHIGVAISSNVFER